MSLTPRSITRNFTLKATRRNALVAAALCALSGVSWAAYPDKPIKILGPWAAGGATDQIARMLAQPLSQALGVPVVVENKGGAGGVIGTQSFVKEKADGYTLLLATSSFEAVKIIGYPEARIILSQCVTYLASSPKSNASYLAINQAQALVKETGNLSVPINLRNAPTKLMKDLNYGKGYQYSHDFPGNFVVQEFLPEEIKNTSLYQPGDNAREQELRNFLSKKWKGKYGY
jgi:hypothetical protein